MLAPDQLKVLTNDDNIVVAIVTPSGTYTAKETDWILKDNAGFRHVSDHVFRANFRPWGAE